MRAARRQVHLVRTRDCFHNDIEMSTHSLSGTLATSKTFARVLIVEDERIVAMDLRRRVEQLGHAVVGTVSTGALAVQCAEKFDPDLVLMDIRLQGEMDGITAAEQIRRAAGLPVIFM